MKPNSRRSAIPVTLNSVAIPAIALGLWQAGGSSAGGMAALPWIVAGAAVIIAVGLAMLRSKDLAGARKREQMMQQQMAEVQHRAQEETEQRIQQAHQQAVEETQKTMQAAQKKLLGEAEERHKKALDELKKDLDRQVEKAQDEARKQAFEQATREAEDRLREEFERKAKAEQEQRLREERRRARAEVERQFREEQERKAEAASHKQPSEVAEAWKKPGPPPKTPKKEAGGREEQKRAEALRRVRERLQRQKETSKIKAVPPTSPPTSAKTPVKGTTKIPAAARRRGRHEPEAPLDPVNVLVGEDSATLRKVFQMALDGEPCQLTLTESADEAVKQAGSVKPDVVFVDLTLSGSDAYAVTRAVKSACGAKVVVLHAKKARYDEAKGQKAGVDATLVKPFSTKELLDAIRANS